MIKKLMMMVEYPPSEASAGGISPERSENCEAISLEVCSMRGAFGAWAETETVGGYTWTYRINGDTAESYDIIVDPTET